MDASWTAAVALLAVCVVLPAQARDLQAPLPPEAVTATMTEAGTVVSWLPPVLDGGLPVEGYAIYRLTDFTHLAWTLAGTTDGLTTHFTDAAASGPALYHVKATNAAGDSPPSVPAFIGTWCPAVGAGVMEGPPYVDVHVNEDCLPVEVRLWFT